MKSSWISFRDMPFLQKYFVTVPTVHFLSLTGPSPVCSGPTEINSFEISFYQRCWIRRIINWLGFHFNLFILSILGRELLARTSYIKSLKHYTPSSILLLVFRSYKIFWHGYLPLELNSVCSSLWCKLLLQFFSVKFSWNFTEMISMISSRAWHFLCPRHSKNGGRHIVLPLSMHLSQFASDVSNFHFIFSGGGIDVFGHISIFFHSRVICPWHLIISVQF